MPSPAQIQTAIAVLRKLGERLNTRAAHAAIESPETCLGADNRARVEAQAIQQTTHIDTVAGQLQNWHDELVAQALQDHSHHV